MPWCPQCGFEYMPGRKLCPDCQIELVEEQPKGFDEPADIGFPGDDEESNESKSMEPLMPIEDGIQAALYANIMRDSEIPYMFKDGYLWVISSEADNARFIITEYMNALDVGDMPEMDEDSQDEPEK